MLKDATASSCFTIAVVIPTSLPLAVTRPSDPYDFSVAIPHPRASKQPRASAANTPRALHAGAPRRMIVGSPTCRTGLADRARAARRTPSRRYADVRS
ncbi:hypothetical protein, partial [Burkholderia sp. LMG 13014]|uniref:hypothetical protein n=1 Tax=Burkholderia sp. LMG 13014 TaxID=2709306 RepID=UPI0019649652